MLVSKTSVGNWETGKVRVTPRMYAKLQKLTGKEISYLRASDIEEARNGGGSSTDH